MTHDARELYRILGCELLGITAGDISAVCWGKRRSSTPPRYMVWPFMLSACVGKVLMLISLKYTDLEEWSNLSFHFVYILSSPLFQFGVTRNEINAVLLYMYLKSMYCRMCSLSCATGYARFSVLIFLFPVDQH